MYETAAKRCFGQLLLAVAAIAVTHFKTFIKQNESFTVPIESFKSIIACAAEEE